MNFIHVQRPCEKLFVENSYAMEFVTWLAEFLARQLGKLSGSILNSHMLIDFAFD